MADVQENRKPHSSKKRKRGGQKKEVIFKTIGRKPKQAKTQKSDADPDLDFESSINLAVGRMTPTELVSHVKSITNQQQTDETSLELSELALPEHAIKDTTAWTDPRTLNALPDFLLSMVDRAELVKPTGSKGTPHTLVVASSALRAADVVRVLRTFQTKRGHVTKLFAKHIKLKDSIELCKSTDMIIGVGTPKRLTDLIADGALSTASLHRVVLDASYIDEKKRWLFSIKEISAEVMKLLKISALAERYGDHGLELIAY